METARAQKLADEYDISFFECSAKADVNVQEAFGALVEQVSARLQAVPAAGGTEAKKASVVSVGGTDAGAGAAAGDKTCCR